jgi:hypothetical protein
LSVFPLNRRPEAGHESRRVVAYLTESADDEYRRPSVPRH